MVSQVKERFLRSEQKGENLFNQGSRPRLLSFGGEGGVVHMIDCTLIKELKLMICILTNSYDVFG